MAGGGAMNHPTSWHDVLECECASCKALAEIYYRCQENDAFLFVCDCRMHDSFFHVADVRKMFRVPAVEGTFDSFSAASVLVFARQAHCDVFLSSYPIIPDGARDYAWCCLSVLIPPNPITR
jgi:hypothetical protein